MVDECLTVTIPQCAKILGISASTCYQLVEQKKLPAIRISERRIVIPKLALTKLLESAGQPK